MSPRSNILPLAAALALVVAALFSNLKNASFIDLDDAVYVMDNPNVTTGLTPQNMAWAFSTDNKAGFWIPLTWLSLQLDATLSGNHLPSPAANRLPDAPPPMASASIYHLHNILLHIVASILLFLFLHQATRQVYASLFAALFWAIHPLRVESVAWVTERKDVLAAVFGFLALLLYVRWARQRHWLTYTGVCAAFALSLMAKPMFVTLPALLLLLDAWPLLRIRNLHTLAAAALEKWPLWLLSLLISVLTVITQRQVQAVRSVSEMGISARIAHAATSYLTYIVAHFRVWTLVPGYPFRHEGALEVSLAIAILAAVSLLVVSQFRRRPWLAVGWLWFLIALLPMIGLVQSGDQSWADRFSYLPSVGLFILILFSAREGWKKRRFLRPILAVAAVVGFVFFSFFTVRQTTYWHNSVTLFTQTLKINPDNFRLHGNLAVALLREGENEQALQQYQEAADLRPDFAPAWLSVGYLDLELNHYNQAILALQKAAQLNPRDPRTRRLHGLALAGAGFLKESIHEFQAALYFNPNDQAAANALADVRQRLAEKQSTRPASSQPAPHP